MGLIKFAIENPVKVAVGVILIVLFGLLGVLRIPVQLTPDVDKPVITVQTRWSGASPQEIESEIVDRQEEKLKSVTNLKKMTSESSRGRASIKLEFPTGVDKDIAYRNVSDKLRQVSDYPDEVDEPVVTATDGNMDKTIAWMVLYSSEGEDVASIKTFVEENVKPILERADGISEVSVYGGLDREVQIVVDPYLLAARGLTFSDVAAALRGQNKNISAGAIAQGKRDYTYRTVGEYRNVEDIEETVVAYQPGGPVFIRDVAKVIDGFKKRTSFVRSKGRKVLALPARRETGANVIKTMENLEEQLAIVNKSILQPRGLGLELTQVYDETKYIWSAIGLVAKNILVGGLLAIAVLVVFLRSGSATIIIAVAIPISVVGTGLIITLLGRSLNVVMLAGMAFAVGMVVDNAIVVLENIYRHRAMGKSKVDAALDGAREVWGAILASTLTTMAVFLPVIFIEEEAGQLFKDISIAIASAVGLSLIVSIIVIPPLSARFFSVSRAMSENGGKPWKLAEVVSSLVSRINQHLGSRIAVVVGLSVMSLAGSWWLMPATAYLPSGNKNLIFGFLTTPPGYSIQEFQQMALLVEEGDPNDPLSPNDGLRHFWEAELGTEEAARLPKVDIPVGKSEGPPGMVMPWQEVRTVLPPPIENFFFVSFGGGAFMGCTSKDDTNVKPLEYAMTRAAQRIAGVSSFFSQSSLFAGGRSGNSLDVEFRSDNLDEVIAAAKAVQGKLEEAGYHGVQSSPRNFELGRPEIQIVPKRTQAADVGLDVREVGFIVESFVDGAFVGEYNDKGDKVDMVVKVSGTENSTVQEIAQIPIYVPTGDVLPLSSVVDIRATTAPQQINHIEEMSSVTLSVQPAVGVPLQAMMREIDEDILAPLRESGVISENVITELAGTADKLVQTQQALIGDFSGKVSRPEILGLSVLASVALILAVFAMLVAAAGLTMGLRPALLLAASGSTILLVLFLALNPPLVLTLFESKMILALLLTYLLMAALFESFVYPFVIMFSVPLALVGGFAALRLVHEVSLNDVTSPIQELDVLTMLGFVILLGVVVNNAILIVHQALNNMREQGLAPQEAVVLSVQTRTRPIFMSALTSVFGMLPLVVMPGAGSELYRGIGSVVVGGLFVSTIFTLVVVPVMFSLVLDLRHWLALALKVREERSPRAAGATTTSLTRSPDA